MLKQYLISYENHFFSHRKRQNREQEIREEIRLAPDDVHHCNELGLILFDGKNISQAEAQFRKAVERDNKELETYFFLTMSLCEQGKYKEAVAVLDNLVKISITGSMEWRSLLERGIIYRHMKLFQKSEECIRKSIQLKDGCSESFIQLGHTFFERKDFDNALVWYRQSLECDEPALLSYLFLAKVMTEQRKFDEVFSLLCGIEKCGIEIPKWRIHLEKGLFFRYRRMFTESAAAINKAVEIDDDNALIYYNLGLTFFQSNRFTDAQENFERAIKCDKYFPEAYFDLSATLAGRNKFDDAFACLESFEKLDLDIYNRQISLEKGKLFRAQKKYDKSIKTLNNILSEHPGNGEIHSQIGQTFFEMKKYESAMVYFEKSIQCDESLHSSYFMISSALRNLGRFEEAFNWLDKFFARCSSFFWNGLIYKALVLRSMEKVKESIQTLLEAHRLAPDCIEIYFHLGDTYLQSGKIDKACQAFTKVISLDKNYIEAYRKLSDTMVKAKRYEEALYFLDCLADLNIPEIEWRIQLYRARVFLSQGRLNESEKRVKQSIAFLPNAEAFYTYGQICMQKREYEEAVEKFNKSHEIDNLYFLPILGQSKSLRLLNKEDRALEKLDEIPYHEAISLRWLIHIERGHCYYASGNNNKGKEEISSAFKLASGSIEKLNLVGKILESKKDYHNALLCFSKILDLNINQTIS